MVTITNNLLGLDTNIFIYYFQQNEEFGLSVRLLFELLAKKKAKAVTSIITLTELLSLPASERDIEALTSHFLETPNLLIGEVNQTIGIEAARIRRVYKFRVPDAIQLATALFYKVDVFITNDQRLKSFSELNIELLSKNTSFE